MQIFISPNYVNVCKPNYIIYNNTLWPKRARDNLKDNVDYGGDIIAIAWNKFIFLRPDINAKYYPNTNTTLVFKSPLSFLMTYKIDISLIHYNKQQYQMRIIFSWSLNDNYLNIFRSILSDI